MEIITSSKQRPNEDWLNIVVTAKAKSKIKDALKEEKRKIADEGKYIVQRKLENFGAAYNQHNIDVLTTWYKLSSSLDFFYQVSVRNIDLKELQEFHLLGDRLEPPRPARNRSSNSGSSRCRSNAGSTAKGYRTDHLRRKQRPHRLYTGQLL